MSKPSKAQNKQAVQLIRALHKVLAYRSHLIPQADLEALNTLGVKADAIISGKGEQAGPGELAQLDTLLAKHGAAYYRHPGWAENIETIVVAFILAIGIRTFFLQPFSIPTNSMYPTYHGMTYELNPLDQPRGPLEKAGRFLKEIALTEEIVAPVAGKMKVKVDVRDITLANRLPSGEETFEQKRLFAGATVEEYKRSGPTNLPMVSPILHSYSFIASDGSKSELRVSPDFSSVNEIILKTWYPEAAGFYAALTKDEQPGPLFQWTEQMLAKGLIKKENGEYFLYMDHEAKAGERVISFDILTGDKLFVDRFSYHFFAPESGDSFVFRTRDVPGLASQAETYYIKRLAGIPGDTLEIKGKQLFRNGELAKGAIGFEKNNACDAEYEGYVNYHSRQTYLRKGQSHKLPAGHYFALGDNSDQSSDSRYWGDVPEKAVVGKALFIHYPFTSRWGRAR